MRTLIEDNEKTTVDEMVAFLKTLTPEEQQKIRSFIQGAMFMRKTRKKGNDLHNWPLPVTEGRKDAG